uniref:formylglycine-generating enzyme family protein n=1 Tax=uncultured Sphingomonas sp. TaxID=158754 RepID=UPI0035CB2688
MLRYVAAAVLLLTSSSVPAQAPQPRASALETFRDCAICSPMIVVPAGHFTMGSPTTEPGHKPDEEPQTSVTVTSFALGETDVTVGQWRSFVKATGHPDGLGCAYSGLPREEAGKASWRHLGFAQGDDEPVVCVSWNEAQSYVRWLSATTGRAYRLPTEAEWEYAARAGKSSVYPWGDTASHDWANYGSDTCCTPATGGRDRWTYTSPVRSFPPNAFGLYDMIGNAWQWTQDCYVASYGGRPADGKAVERTPCQFRTARGGTWGDTPALTRSGARNYAPPPRMTVAEYRSAGFGFRVATSDVPSKPHH